MSYSRSTTMTLGDATVVKHSMGSNKVVVYCKVTQMVISIIHHFYNGRNKLYREEKKGYIGAGDSVDQRVMGHLLSK